MENLGVLRAALEEEENKEDPFFKRLPDELIISHILGKVSEAKSLCRCSLVSKKFSSLVYKTKNVSVKITFHIPIPQPKSNPEEPTTKYAAFPGKLVHVVTYPLVFVQNIALKSMMEMFLPIDTKFDIEFLMDKNNLPKFFGKFTGMESLIVEIDYSASFNFHKEPVIKWKLDKKSGSFILLMAPKSFIDNEKEESRNRYKYPQEEIQSNDVVFDCHLAIAICSVILFAMLVPSLPESLVRLVITDSKENGKIDFGETDLVEMRRRRSSTRGGINPNSITEEEERNYYLRKLVLLEQLMLAIGKSDALSCVKVISFCLGNGGKSTTKGKGKGKQKGKKGKMGKGKGKGKMNDDNEGDYDDDYLRVKNAFRGRKAVFFDAVMEMLMEIKGSF